MAGNLAEEQKHKVGCDFDRYNGEFVQPAHTVGLAYLPNNKNIVQQNSCGCESLTDKNTALTPFSTLTTATNEAKTRMNSAFAGGGGI